MSIPFSSQRGSDVLPAKLTEEVVQRKFDPKVFQLGYVALETADIERTKAH
jgi:hypothetical protein